MRLLHIYDRQYEKGITFPVGCGFHQVGAYSSAPTPEPVKFMITAVGEPAKIFSRA